MNFALWHSPLGWIGFAADARGLRALTVPRNSSRNALANLEKFGRGTRDENEHIRLARAALERYFTGDVRAGLDRVTLDLEGGTKFEQRVWSLVRAIPYGETRTYAEIARLAGRPRAARAVGQCNAKNPWAIIVPCHRLVGSDGKLIGYEGGLEMKRQLLELEGIDVNKLGASARRSEKTNAHRN